MRLAQDLLVGDLHPSRHQQTHVLDQIGGQLVVGDVAVRDVQPEILRGQAAAVGEVDDEVEFDAWSVMELLMDAGIRGGAGLRKIGRPKRPILGMLPIDVGLNELLGRTRLFMLENVNESAERIFDVEPADAPRLTSRAVFHRDLAFLNPTQCLVKIIHLYG